jgi:mono/diheme cytochrome c family protein
MSDVNVLLKTWICRRAIAGVALSILVLLGWSAADDKTVVAVHNQPVAAEADSLAKAREVGKARSRYLRSRPDDSVTDATPKLRLDEFQKKIKPLLKNNCVRCHGPDTQEGNVRIDSLDTDLMRGKDVDWWLEILAVLTNGEMPPPDESELSEEQRRQLVEWLSQEIHNASTVRRGTAEYSSFRRLTRYEYNYALQDLLGLPWDFGKDLLPEADSEDGFQNSSELLHMSVQQIETYRRLARKALMRTTVRGERPPTLHWRVSMRDVSSFEWPKQAEQIKKLKEKHQDDPATLQQEMERLEASFQVAHGQTYFKDHSTDRTARASWSYYNAKYAFSPQPTPPEPPAMGAQVAILPGGRNQKLTIELGHRVPDEGMMRVRVRAAHVAGSSPHPPSLQLEFGWQASNEGRALLRVSRKDIPIVAGVDAPQFYQFEIPLGEIYPRNSVRKTSSMGAMPNPSEYVRLVNSSADPAAIQIDYVEVSAPVYDEWPPRSHQRIFGKGESSEEELPRAREILQSFMTRAWRRPIIEEELEQKIKLFTVVRGSCDSLQEAMVEVLATVLSSPQFLYVVRDDTFATTDKGASLQLSEYELATRLSLLLWASIPDDQLLGLARQGKLSDPEVLEQQIDRMLADPRSGRLSKHFVEQWLDMKLLEFLNVKSERRFDPLLKEAMQHEPVALFQQILETNASVLDFLHADYTMGNERLARHYGIADVHGNEFRRIALTSTQHRGGLLTQAGLLTMNSDGEDSHPLKRGIWLLRSLLNDPPPPPPPAVPEIDLADPEIAKMTLKDRIENHRNHAACMSCHSKIDPWGIAFENYDALGRWRTEIDGNAVDATSLLFNNQELDGMNGLKSFLIENRQDQFIRALVNKLTTYALGRPVTFADHARVDTITREVRREGDGLATMIRLIVTSELFQSP